MCQITAYRSCKEQLAVERSLMDNSNKLFLAAVFIFLLSLLAVNRFQDLHFIPPTWLLRVLFAGCISIWFPYRQREKSMVQWWFFLYAEWKSASIVWIFTQRKKSVVESFFVCGMKVCKAQSNLCEVSKFWKTRHWSFCEWTGYKIAWNASLIWMDQQGPERFIDGCKCLMRVAFHRQGSSVCRRSPAV